jgi:hypothetical protein
MSLSAKSGRAKTLPAKPSEDRVSSNPGMDRHLRKVHQISAAAISGLCVGDRRLFGTRVLVAVSVKLAAASL